MKGIYGNEVKDLANAVVVSHKEATRLQERAKRLNLRCTCLKCNPSKEVK